MPDDTNPWPATPEEDKIDKTVDSPGAQSDTMPAYGAKDKAPRAELATPEDKERQQLDTEYKDAIQQSIDFRRQYQKDREEQAKSNQWVHQQQQKLLSEPIPQMPSYQDLYGGVQTQQQEGVLKQLRHKEATAMMIYAAIALPLAAFARGAAGAGAMRGFADGMESIRAGFDDRAKESMSLWKAHNDELIAQGDRQMKYYGDILANRKLDMEERMQNLQHVAEAIGDKPVADAAVADQYQKVATLIHQREQLMNSAKKNSRNLEQAIFPKLGLDAEHKDYVNRIAMKYPELRKKLYGSTTEDFYDALDEASKKGYDWGAFIKEKSKESKELKGKPDTTAPSGAGVGGLGLDLPKDQSTEEQGGGGGEW